MQTVILPILRCQGNNEAVKLCFEAKCDHSSVMCNALNCQCNHTHRNCLGDIPVEKIIGFVDSRAKHSETTFEKVMDFYERMKKQITREQEELKIMIEKRSLCLKEEELSLYAMMRRGDTTGMKSSLVARVVDSFRKSNGEIKHQQLEERAGKRLEGIYNSIQSLLKEVRHLWVLGAKDWPSKPKVSLQFDYNLTYPNMQIIDGNRVKKVNKSSSFCFLSALSPSLNEVGSDVQKHSFKILNSRKNSLAIGVCDLAFIQPPKGEKATQHNLQLCSGVFAHFDQRVVNSKCEWVSLHPLRVNEVLQITYDPKNYKITFRNSITNETKAVEMFSLGSSSQQYLCVGLMEEKDEVEYLGPV